MSDAAITRTVVVTDPAGVHARTAVAIAEVVRGGQSTVTLTKDDRCVPGTEVLQVLTLVAEPGETVRLDAVGPDAAVVLDRLEPLFAGRFGDDAQTPA